jgi:hypothetical protein
MAGRVPPEPPGQFYHSRALHNFCFSLEGRFMRPVIESPSKRHCTTVGEKFLTCVSVLLIAGLVVLVFLAGDYISPWL